MFPSDALMPKSTNRIAESLALRLRAERDSIVRRWLDRISARVSIAQNRVFPSEDLINHVPILVDGIADYIERPEDGIDANVPATAKARELGALRHSQGFDAYQILKEHELFGAILTSFLTDSIDEIGAGAAPSEIAACWNRLARALESIRQATVAHFLQLASERVREREERLRRFNRMVSHELKNRVSAIRGAGGILAEEWIGDEQRERFVQMVSENAAGLQRVLENLEQMSRLDSDSRHTQNVLLPHAVAEATRQLRDAAEARDVKIEVDPLLPMVEVNAAVVELCLTNYLSNGIKYSNPKTEDRWVRIGAELIPPNASRHGGELVVEVRDNGVGVPKSAREKIFGQFYRAHADTITGIEGSGLGLSIVRETVESLGGRAWAEFPEDGGTIFAFALPSRREADAAAAGITRATRAPLPPL